MYCSVLGTKAYSPGLWLLQLLNKTGIIQVARENTFMGQASNLALQKSRSQ